MKKKLQILVRLLTCGIVSSALAAGEVVVPDFTKGDAIPAKATHDWNLGPTGLRGWMFCDKMVTSDARQIAVTRVDPGSPADGRIAAGDVLLGAGGKPFAIDPRTELGRAISAAETAEGGGKLTLTRWRAGVVEGFSCTIMRCSRGSEKAAVLPVPVWAAPMTSRPCSTTGIACS